MKEQLKKEYEEWARYISEILREDRSWVELYKDYAIRLIKNMKGYIESRSRFREPAPLHIYLSVGRVKDNKKEFDLRYLGQSVGCIVVKNDESVNLVVSDKQAENNNKYFGYDLGPIKSANWSNSADAREFRKFFKEDSKGMPRQKEHMVESALFSETGKRSSATKTLCNITPVSYAGTRIHMKTAVRASDSGKKGCATVSDAGGEIDLLCRRSIKSGRGESRLVVIEIKDKNEKSESFDTTMKQAITYGVFIRELIISEAGEYWMELWGMKNQKHAGFTIDCVVAMPEGETKPSYNGDILSVGDSDNLQLHYMEFTNIDPDNVQFKTSMENKK